MKIRRIASTRSPGHGQFAPGSLPCPNAARAAQSDMTRFLARRALNYLVLLALASFLTFCLASWPSRRWTASRQRNPRAAAVRHRRQGRRAGPRQARYRSAMRTGCPTRSAATSARPSPASPSSDELWRRIGVSLRLVVIGSVLGTVIGVVRRRVGRHPPVPAVRPHHHRAVAAAAQHADVRRRQPADPRRAAGQYGAGVQPVRVHRRDVADAGRRGRGPVRRPPAASRAADGHLGAVLDRRLQPLPAQRDARRARPGFHPHRARQGPDAGARRCSNTACAPR